MARPKKIYGKGEYLPDQNKYNEEKEEEEKREKERKRTIQQVDDLKYELRKTKRIMFSHYYWKYHAGNFVLWGSIILGLIWAGLNTLFHEVELTNFQEDGTSAWFWWFKSPEHFYIPVGIAWILGICLIGYFGYICYKIIDECYIDSLRDNL